MTKEAVVMGGAGSTERAAAASEVIEALKPAILILANTIAPESLLDGLLSLYINVGVVLLGAGVHDVQSALRDAADLLPESVRRRNAMMGMAAGNA